MFQEDYLLYALQEEDIIFNGIKRRIHRVFVRGPDSGTYFTVGWILLNDVDNCIICKKVFGIYLHKHHCRACGNIVCINCSDMEAEVDELIGCGRQRVCKMCYYGQEPVLVTHSYIKESDHIDDKSNYTTLNNKLNTAIAETDKDIQFRIDQEKRLKNRRGSALKNIVDNNNEKIGSVAIENLLRNDNDVVMNSDIKTITVIPHPCFVMKAYYKLDDNDNNMKIFINVCSHTSMPYADCTTNDVLSKQFNIIVGVARKTLDKGGNEDCIVCDVLLAEDDIKAYELDTSNALRNQLCGLVISKVSEKLKLRLVNNNEYKVLTVKNNYKSNGSDLTIQEMRIPYPAVEYFAKTSFYFDNAPLSSITNVTATRVPSGEKDEHDLKTNNITVCIMSSAAVKTSILTSAQRVLSSATSAVMDPASLVVDVGNAATKYTLNTITNTTTALINPTTTLKNATKTIANAAATASNVFSADIGSGNDERISIKVEDFVIYPEAGFVISSRRQGGMKFYINVCHHDIAGVQYFNKTVGTKSSAALSKMTMSNLLSKVSSPSNWLFSNKKSNDTSSITYSQSLELKDLVSFIVIGSMQMFVDSSNVAIVESAVALDIVIPTLYYTRCVTDITGENYNNVAICILEYIAGTGVILDNDFELPKVVPYVTPLMQSFGGSIPIDFYSKIIPPVFNLSINQDNSNYKLVVIEGIIFKQGHAYKSWKQRRFQLVGSKLRYFNKIGIMKGEIDVKNTYVKTVLNDEAHSPIGTFPFMIASQDKGIGSYMYFYTQSERDRELWMIIIDTQSRLQVSMNALRACPGIKYGFLKKEGHIFRNWRRRYFVLDMGVLRYYKDEGKGKASGHGSSLKGEIFLDDCIIQSKGDNRIYLCTKNNSKDLLVEAEDNTTRESWLVDLQRHSLYAKENSVMTNVENRPSLLEFTKKKN